MSDTRDLPTTPYSRSTASVRQEDPVNLFLFYLSCGYDQQTAFLRSGAKPGLRLEIPFNVKIEVKSL